MFGYSSQVLVDEDAKQDEKPLILNLHADSKAGLVVLMGSCLALRSLNLLSRVKIVIASSFAGYFLAFFARAYVRCKDHILSSSSANGVSPYQQSVTAWRLLTSEPAPDEVDWLRKELITPLIRFVKEGHSGAVLSAILKHPGKWCSKRTQVLQDHISKEFGTTVNWSHLRPSRHMGSFSWEPVFIWNKKRALSPEERMSTMDRDDPLFSDSEESIAVFRLAKVCCEMYDTPEDITSDDPFNLRVMERAYRTYISATEASQCAIVIDAATQERRKDQHSLTLRGWAYERLLRKCIARPLVTDHPVVSCYPDLPPCSTVTPFLKQLSKDTVQWSRLANAMQLHCVNWGKCCTMLCLATQEHQMISWFVDEYRDPYDFSEYFQVTAKTTDDSGFLQRSGTSKPKHGDEKQQLIPEDDHKYQDSDALELEQL